MSYCHVAPVRYGAVALRVGVHLLIVAQRGERTPKKEREWEHSEYPLSIVLGATLPEWR